jgi:uncharacterized membrane protein
MNKRIQTGIAAFGLITLAIVLILPQYKQRQANATKSMLKDAQDCYEIERDQRIRLQIQLRYQNDRIKY